MSSGFQQAQPTSGRLRDITFEADRCEPRPATNPCRTSYVPGPGKQLSIHCLPGGTLDGAAALQQIQHNHHHGHHEQEVD